MLNVIIRQWRKIWNLLRLTLARRLATAPIAKTDPTIMRTVLQFGLPRQIAGLFLLLYYLTACDGRAADVVAPTEGSAGEAIVSQARLSLVEARKTQSDRGLRWAITSMRRMRPCGR